MTVSAQERPIEKIIASLLARHHLVRIEFSVTANIINARAIPQAYHPQVSVNCQAALEKASRTAGGSISLREAQQIVEDAPQTAIAHAYGDTFQEVLKALGKKLRARK